MKISLLTHSISSPLEEHAEALSLNFLKKILCLYGLFRTLYWAYALGKAAAKVRDQGF